MSLGCRGPRRVAQPQPAAYSAVSDGSLTTPSARARGTVQGPARPAAADAVWAFLGEARRPDPATRADAGGFGGRRGGPHGAGGAARNGSAAARAAATGAPPITRSATSMGRCSAAAQRQAGRRTAAYDAPCADQCAPTTLVVQRILIPVAAVFPNTAVGDEWTLRASFEGKQGPFCRRPYSVAQLLLGHLISNLGCSRISWVD